MCFSNGKCRWNETVLCQRSMYRTNEICNLTEQETVTNVYSRNTSMYDREIVSSINWINYAMHTNTRQPRWASRVEWIASPITITLALLLVRLHCYIHIQCGCNLPFNTVIWVELYTFQTNWMFLSLRTTGHLELQFHSNSVLSQGLCLYQGVTNTFCFISLYAEFQPLRNLPRISNSRSNTLFAPKCAQCTTRSNIMPNYRLHYCIISYRAHNIVSWKQPLL